LLWITIEKIKNKNGNCVKEQRTEQTEKLKLILKTGHGPKICGKLTEKRGNWSTN